VRDSVRSRVLSSLTFILLISGAATAVEACGSDDSTGPLTLPDSGDGAPSDGTTPDDGDSSARSDGDASDAADASDASDGSDTSDASDASDAADAGSNLTIVAIHGDSYATCALRVDGKVKCWGEGFNLGLGGTANRGDQPNEMGDSLPFVDLGTGHYARALGGGGGHTCAVLEDHRLKCWGANDYGQLGLGNKDRSGDQANEMGDALPAVDVGTGRTAKQVEGGDIHTCALLDNDRIKCWGYNLQGQLGIGDKVDRGGAAGQMGDALPFVDLGTNRTAKSVVAGGSISCAITDENKVKCWGTGSYGRTGLGSTADRGDGFGLMGDALPYVDLGPSLTVKALAIGDSHACVIVNDDRVKCWGYNAYGQLGLSSNDNRGDQSNEMGSALPYVNLGTGRTAKALALGFHHTCAILDNDSLKCWGLNGHGQLGLGDGNNRGGTGSAMGDALDSVDLGTGRSAKAITAGNTHTCALLDDGTVKCWGYNAYGQLGLGTNVNRGNKPNQMGDALPALDLGN
jgi:E3 ubiquitin-protein ligase HERC3